MKDCPVLSQLPEGFLGKLQIRKSGKVELKLGDVAMDVCGGAALSFLQVRSVSCCRGLAHLGQWVVQSLSECTPSICGPAHRGV